MIHEWCNFNQHTLVTRPTMHVFPSTYIEKKDKRMPWDIHNYPNETSYTNYSYINNESNDVVKNYNYNGYTGIGILMESHISIHTYPEQNCMYIDFFSCRYLDKTKNKHFIEHYFEKSKTTIFDVQFINRKL